MTQDHLRYDILTQEALLGMIGKVLSEVGKTGLPGDHHFFITFDTNSPGVQLSTRMREQYPEDMTIVVQHRFWDMEVKDEGFQIGLSFDDIAEHLFIPFASIRGFYDPSVKFGLQFELQETDNIEKLPGPKLKNTQSKKSAKKKKSGKKASKKQAEHTELFEGEVEKFDNSEDDKATSTSTRSDEEQSGADVVSLDSFRKKK